MINNNCQLLVISGPSGAGKTTLIKMLRQKYPQILFSISHTTRPPRPDEKEGENYYYISRDKFMNMIASKEFIEWAEVHNNLYGTSLMEIKIKSNLTSTLILDVDLQGAKNIKIIFPQAILIFITPSSLQELINRITKRNNEETFDLKTRLQTARHEILEAEEFDYLICNDNLQIAFSQLESVYMTTQLAVRQRKELISKLIGEIDEYNSRC